MMRLLSSPRVPLLLRAPPRRHHRCPSLLRPPPCWLRWSHGVSTCTGDALESSQIAGSASGCGDAARNYTWAGCSKIGNQARCDEPAD